MNKRRLFLLFFSIVSIALIAAGLFYWAYGQWAELNLRGYIERLEKRGYYVEEHSLSDFHVDDSQRVKFSDFTFEADFQEIDYIYFERRIHALYFLIPIQGHGMKAIVFYYK